MRNLLKTAAKRPPDSRDSCYLTHLKHLISIIFVTLLFTATTSAKSFKTSLTAADDGTYHQPSYPLIFVSAPIKEVENKYGGVSGAYALGADVLDANDPSGGNKLWILLPNGETKLLFPLEHHQQQNLIDTPEGLVDSGSVVEPNLSEDGKTVYFSYFHNGDQKMQQSGLSKLGAPLARTNVQSFNGLGINSGNRISWEKHAKR